MPQRVNGQFVLNLVDTLCSASSLNTALVGLKLQLSTIFPFNSVLFLAQTSESYMATLVSSDPQFEGVLWPQGLLFNDAFNERVIKANKLYTSLEFSALPADVLAQCQQVILCGLSFAGYKGIVVFTLAPDMDVTATHLADLMTLEPVFKSLFLQSQQQKLLGEQVADRTFALKSSEQRFRAFAQLASDWFWETDATLSYTYLSNEENTVKCIKYNHFLTKTPLELRSEREASQLKKWGLFLHLVNQHQPIHDFEYEVKALDGSHFWISLSGEAKYDLDGKFTGYFGIGKDITFAKQREFDFKSAKEKAEHANEAKSRFLAVLSHEIRTPMNSILGMLELLEDSGINPQQYEYLDYIRSSAQILHSVISDTLDFAKIESGTIELESKTVNLHKLINNIAKQFETLAVKQELAFHLYVSSDVPELIEGDSTRLAQVLFNVLGNAFKFTPEGQVSLDVTIKQQQLHFCIKDSGIGISAYDISRLFEPFSQANSSIQRAQQGVGLGLSIAKQILLLMGGDIHCHSKLGLYTEFNFYLPLRLAGASIVTSNLQVQNKHRPLSILVAEDNLPNQLVIKALLEKRNHQVTLVDNGSNAFDIAIKQSFDLILMDMMMPVMDGLVATKKIRELFSPHDLPIIALTANASFADKQRCLDSGMNDVLTKPVDSIVLAEKINFYGNKSNN